MPTITELIAGGHLYRRNPERSFPPMPRFNARGDWNAGVGGDGVHALVNGQIIDPGPGGAGDWLSDEEFVGARWTNWDDFRAVAISKTGVQRELQHGVFNHVYGGGGRWGVNTRDNRWTLDNGQEVLPIVGFGQDGCLVTWASRSQGLIIAGRTVTDATVYVQHVIDANTAIWMEADGPHTIGMPVPHLLPGPVYGLRVGFDGAKWWALYESGSLEKLVLHPFDSFDGYALNATFDPHNSATWAYRPDLAILGGAKHVIWATIESEQLGQIAGPYVADVQFQLQALQPIPGTPPPNPGPIPVPVPEPPKMRTIPTPARAIAIVQALYEKNVQLSNGSDDDRRALMRLIAEQQCFELGPEWGTKSAGPGRPQTKDAIARLVGSTLYVADAFNGSTRQPSVASVMDESEGQVFIAVPAINHLGDVTQPAPEPTPTPTPVPSPGNEDQLLVWMVDIEKRLSKLEAWTRGV